MQNKIRKILQKLKTISFFKRKKEEEKKVSAAPDIPEVPPAPEVNQPPEDIPAAPGSSEEGMPDLPPPSPASPPQNLPQTPSKPPLSLVEKTKAALSVIPQKLKGASKPKLPKSRKEVTQTISTIFTKAQRFAYAVDFREFWSRLISERRITTTHGSLSFEQIIDKIFNQHNRSEIHYYFLIAVFCSFSFLLGSLLSNFLSSSKSYKNLISDDLPKLNFSKMASGSDLKFIKDKKLFQTGKVQVKQKLPTQQVNKGPEICTEETSKRSSSLPITLLNTIVLQDSVKSIASVQVRSELFDLREGEKINNMAKIDRITRMKLIIKNLNSGECENIMASEAKEMMSLPKNVNVLSPRDSKKFVKEKKTMEGIKNDGNKFEISKKLLKGKMSNITEILSQARGIPINNPDGSLSFKIVDIEPGSVYTYLGIEDGDVITHINGNKINNMNEIMNMFGNIQNIDQLNLMIERNGSSTPLDYVLK